MTSTEEAEGMRNALATAMAIWSAFAFMAQGRTDMTTHVTVNLDPAAFGLVGPAVPFEFSHDFAGADNAILNTVWAICNSSPEEMFCHQEYRPIVEQYRERKHRSLSVGDTVTLDNGERTRTYRVTTIGFEAV